jgi:putative adhesin
MKFRVIFISLVVVLLSMSMSVLARNDRLGDVHPQQTERVVAADASVTVSLCVMSGSVTVHGWNKNEVLARTSDVAQIDLKRTDGPKQSGPATRLEVLMVDSGDDHRGPNDCQGFGDVELMVPHGASVYVRTGDGAISISEVASVYAKTQTGDIEIDKASRSIEAVSFNSDVSISDSTGRITLRSVAGSVSAVGVRPGVSDDVFEASTISGDIDLNQVIHSQLSVRTVNGNVHLDGPLAQRGEYNFNTTTGDVTLALPSDASFRLNATVSQNQNITSDFELTEKTETSTTIAQAKSSASTNLPPKKVESPPTPAPTSEPHVVVVVEPKVKIKVDPVVVKAIYTTRRITAVHGTGDAVINVASFLGTLHLEKN